MATTTTRPGARPAGEGAADAPAAAPAGKKPGRSKRKLIVIALPVLLLGVAAKMFLLGGGGAAAHDVAPKPGPVVRLDAVTVNLAAGHYLQVGVAIEFTDAVSAASPPDGARATDQVIAYFTGRNAASLETATGLAEAKKGLQGKITTAYPHDPVYDILVTSFVVQ